MMARACYPDVKISKQQLQFGECASNERKDFALTVTNKNEDLPLDFRFTKVASFKALPLEGVLLPGNEHTIHLSFEPKSLGMVTQEMTLEILGGKYRIPLKLQGHCNKVGQRPNGIRGPMARPQDFLPERQYIADDAAEARTLPKQKGAGPPSFEDTKGVKAALERGNFAEVEKYAEIQANKQKASDFLTRERRNRERDVRIQQ